VDRYIAGEDIPFAQVQQAWRNVVGTINAPSPVYESFYRAVREANLKRRGKHQIRIALGCPSADWDTIDSEKNWSRFWEMATRGTRVRQKRKSSIRNATRFDYGRGHFLRLRGQVCPAPKVNLREAD